MFFDEQKNLNKHCNGWRTTVDWWFSELKMDRIHLTILVSIIVLLAQAKDKPIQNSRSPSIVLGKMKHYMKKTGLPLNRL